MKNEISVPVLSGDSGSLLDEVRGCGHSLGCSAQIMITRFKNWWLVMSSLLVSTQLCSAQAPSGTLNFPFDNSLPIWDLSGGYHVALVNTDKNGQTTPVEFDIVISQDSRGQLSGTGESIVQIGENFVAGAYEVKGSIRRQGGVSVVNLSVKIDGRDTIAGKPDIAFTLNVDTKAEVDINDNGDGILIGDSKINATFRGMGKLSGTSDFSLALPAGMDGTWDLTLNVITLGKKLSGTAGIMLSNNRPLNFDLSGKTSSGASQANLKGTGGSEPAHLSITFDEETCTVENGEALGQALK